jgi:hypothetical protein
MPTESVIGLIRYRLGSSLPEDYPPGNQARPYHCYKATARRTNVQALAKKHVTAVPKPCADSRLTDTITLNPDMAESERAKKYIAKIDALLQTVN